MRTMVSGARCHILVQRANVVVHPLHAAASSGLVPPSDCPKLVAKPSPGFRCDQPDSLGMSPLHWASLLGRSEWIAALIGCGADPDVLSPSRVTPLHYAAREGHVQATEALLAKNATVDCQDVLGASPLVSAAAGGHAGVVRVLCAAGANLELRTSTGKTALLVALGSCNVEMALILLEAGARTDQRSHPHGLTPLHMAAQDGREEMVRALCSRGAGSSIELREANNGFTPLVSAIARGHLGVALALLEHGACAESRTAMHLTPLMVAVVLGRWDMIKMLLRHGARPDAAGIGGLTPLHLAAENGFEGAVEILLGAGADPCVRVDDPPPRSTPLHVACRTTRLACVEALLRGGADETLQDFTPARGHDAGGGLGAATSVVGPEGAHEPLHASSPLSPPPPPPTAAIDVVGLGRFHPEEDPDRVDVMETDEEHAMRRDPLTMELIRRALRRAPLDRAWRRRSWLMMLKARHDEGRGIGDTRVSHHAQRAEDSSARPQVREARLGWSGHPGYLGQGRRHSWAGRNRLARSKRKVNIRIGGKTLSGLDMDKGKALEAWHADGKRLRQSELPGEPAGLGQPRGEGHCPGIAVRGIDGGESLADGRGGAGVQDGSALRWLCFRLFALAETQGGAFRRIVGYM